MILMIFRIGDFDDYKGFVQRKDAGVDDADIENWTIKKGTGRVDGERQFAETSNYTVPEVQYIPCKRVCKA